MFNRNEESLQDKQVIKFLESPLYQVSKASGSGALKEMRLHNAEMRAKTLEKENVKLEEHEEFYINKAREWNSRALKYERTMEQHGVVVSGKENRRDTVVKAANSEPDKPPSLSLPSPFLYLTQKQPKFMRTRGSLREQE